MGTHGYFFIGSGELKEFLGYLRMDGYPWERGGFKHFLAARTENEFRHLATSLGLYPSNVGVTSYDLKKLEYSYCWEDGKVSIFRNGKPFIPDGFPEWLQKKQQLDKEATEPMNSSKEDTPGQRLIQAMRKVLDRFETEFKLK